MADTQTEKKTKAAPKGDAGKAKAPKTAAKKEGGEAKDGAWALGSRLQLRNPSCLAGHFLLVGTRPV